MRRKIYRSEAMAALHEMMEDAYRAGIIDARKMHEFDMACLVPSEVSKRNRLKVTRKISRYSAGMGKSSLSH